jgi:hypothetical protein
MYRLATAMLFLSSPAFAQNNDVLRDCPPIGQTGKGELIYSLDCVPLQDSLQPVKCLSST